MQNTDLRRMIGSVVSLVFGFFGLFIFGTLTLVQGIGGRQDGWLPWIVLVNFLTIMAILTRRKYSWILALGWTISMVVDFTSSAWMLDHLAPGTSLLAARIVAASLPLVLGGCVTIGAYFSARGAAPAKPTVLSTDAKINSGSTANENK